MAVAINALGEEEGDAAVEEDGEVEDACAEGDGGGEDEHFFNWRSPEGLMEVEAEAGGVEGREEHEDLGEAGDEDEEGEEIDGAGLTGGGFHVPEACAENGA